jgi:hypothetical protein
MLKAPAQDVVGSRIFSELSILTVIMEILTAKA